MCTSMDLCVYIVRNGEAGGGGGQHESKQCGAQGPSLQATRGPSLLVPCPDDSQGWALGGGWGGWVGA